MDFLNQLWEYESFRGAVRSILNLPERSLAQLAAAQGLPENEQETAQRLGLRPIALQALQVIRERGNASQVDPNDIVAALGALLEDDERQVVEHNRAVLAHLFSVSTEAARQTFQVLSSTGIYPAVVSSRIAVDFRFESDPDSGAPVLLPLVSIRLEFDEPIGGSSATWLQIPADALDSLIEALQRARGHVEDASKVLGDLVWK